MATNIYLPTYRAKKLGTCEYVQGFLIKKNYANQKVRYFILSDKDIEIPEVDANSLSIHFPDMLDSQGNKIFASLSEDGKGGDILKTRGNEAPCKFNKGFTIETIMGISNLYILLDKVKVIGIQE